MIFKKNYDKRNNHKAVGLVDVTCMQKVAMPTTTYEARTDPVSYRVERYEPVTSPCQQVPDVWDRAQTRQMMDHVVGDSDYVYKVNETLPTAYVHAILRVRIN